MRAQLGLIAEELALLIFAQGRTEIQVSIARTQFYRSPPDVGGPPLVIKWEYAQS
jgi:hypothetical protein